MLIYTGNNLHLKDLINEYNQFSKKCATFMNQEPGALKLAAVISTFNRLGSILGSCNATEDGKKWVRENLEDIKGEVSCLQTVMNHFKEWIKRDAADDIKTTYYRVITTFRAMVTTLNNLTPPPPVTPTPQPPKRQDFYEQPSEKKGCSPCCVIL